MRRWKGFSSSAAQYARCLSSCALDLILLQPTSSTPPTIQTPRQPTRIRELPPDERPREKLAAHGAGALTSPELIAILLRTGVPGKNAIEVGRELLQKYGSLRGLSRCSVDELKRSEERRVGKECR